MKKNNKNKILFIDPLFSEGNKNTPGIAYLRGFLESKNFLTKSLNLNKEINLALKKEIIKKISNIIGYEEKAYNNFNFYFNFFEITKIFFIFFQLKPKEIWNVIQSIKFLDKSFEKYCIENKEFDYVAFSVTFSNQILFALMLIYYIKKRSNWNPKIILGGSFVSAQYEDLLYLFKEEPLVDFLIIGEGETPLYRLVSGDSLNKVPNLIYKKGKTYKKTEDLNHFEDFSVLPAPVYNLGDTVYLQMSRGCYWGKCNFCTLDNYHFGLKHNKTRSCEKILDELTTISSKLNSLEKSKDVIFLDSSLDYKFINFFCDNIISTKYSNYNYSAYIRCDKMLDENFFSRMKKAGFKKIIIGAETMQPVLQKNINKGINNEFIIRNASLCNKFGIKFVMNYMISLPGQTKELLIKDLKEIEKIAKKNKEYILIDIIPMMIERGSYFYKNPAKFNIKLFKDKREFLSNIIPYCYTDNSLSPREAVSITRDYFDEYLFKLGNVSFFSCEDLV